MAAKKKVMKAFGRTAPMAKGAKFPKAGKGPVRTKGQAKKTLAALNARGKKAPQKAFKRSNKPLRVLGRGDGRPNRAAGGTAG